MEDRTMLKKSVWTAGLGMLTAIGLLAGPTAAWAQYTVSERNDGAPLNVNQSFRFEPMTETVAIKAGHMFDSKAGTMLTNQVILVKGDRIVDVGPSVAIPAGTRVIDLSKATVLPGLIDHHAHTTSEGANANQLTLNGYHLTLKNVNGGFTTIMDMGARTYATVDIRDAINAGKIPGPRMQVAGPQVNPRESSYYPSPSEPQPFFQGKEAWQEAPTGSRSI
jgi:hypothetical protein